MFDSWRVLSKYSIFLPHHLARHVTLYGTSSRSNSTHTVESIEHLFMILPKPQLFGAPMIRSVNTWRITWLLPFTLSIPLINLLGWPFYNYMLKQIISSIINKKYYHIYPSKHYIPIIDDGILNLSIAIKSSILQFDRLIFK